MLIIFPPRLSLSYKHSPVLTHQNLHRFKPVKVESRCLVATLQAGPARRADADEQGISASQCHARMVARQECRKMICVYLRVLWKSLLLRRSSSRSSFHHWDAFTAHESRVYNYHMQFSIDARTVKIESIDAIDEYLAFVFYSLLQY